MKTKEEKRKRRTSEKRIKMWTLKGETLTEYRDKVQKKVGHYLRKPSWWRQKRYVEPPQDGNTCRGRPGDGMKKCRRA